MLSLIGVMLGAGVQYFAGRTLESRKQLALQRSQAYVDYFKAAALIAQHGPSKDALALAADAKIRVCLYGSPPVIKYLSAFEAAGAVVKSPAAAAVIMDLLRAMRADTGIGDASISLQDLQNIVLGSKFAASR